MWLLGTWNVSNVTEEWNFPNMPPVFPSLPLYMFLSPGYLTGTSKLKSPPSLSPHALTIPVSEAPTSSYSKSPSQVNFTASYEPLS